ncbi:MAG TPA: hypothetical protein VKP88_07640 [Candidatus Paceibacterota bacterium]|nr:hypothetical protein [Candidatus Paceibacterota bacterium]
MYNDKEKELVLTVCRIVRRAYNGENVAGLYWAVTYDQYNVLNKTHPAFIRGIDYEVAVLLSALVQR